MPQVLPAEYFIAPNVDTGLHGRQGGVCCDDHGAVLNAAAMIVR